MELRIIYSVTVGGVSEKTGHEMIKGLRIHVISVMNMYTKVYTEK